MLYERWYILSKGIRRNVANMRFLNFAHLLFVGGESGSLEGAVLNRTPVEMRCYWIVV